ncbi:LysE family translocator [Microvirga massiliensis]|uniref:LysE family translocator n=1 Tax=Microvirga massiliensis TaxID=1033741 RepID=UPI00062B635E|nr:LysE family translocator [Microvirga massiliensis]
MPNLDLFLAFVLAIIVLMLMPGPNVVLIVANSVAYGARYGLLTVAGTSSAMIIQLGIVALGMTEALHAAASWFEWIRWLGVIYLVGLGIKEWRAPPVDLTRTNPEPKSARAIYARGLLVSVTNPKTLLFYGAFFPQFVRPEGDIGLQVAVLSVTFLALAVLIDGAWAVTAGRARWLLASRGRLRNRLSGGLLMGAGLGLAMARARP